MSEVSRLEKLKSEDRLSIDRLEMLERLSRNKDFQRLINDQYMVTECAVLAHTAGNPALSKDQREDAMQMAMASGHLKRFLRVTEMQGIAARARVDELNAAIEDARLEKDEI